MALDGTVAVVVLSWNGREDTLDCLESLARSRHPGVVSVVVDNGSTDGTAEAVTERFPDAVLVRSERNLGFAGGNNLGLERAAELGAAYSMLLNNDTIVDPDCIPLLVEEAARRPDVGALCPLILYADPPDLIWYAGAEWNPRRGHNPRQTGYGERDRGQFSDVQEVSRASGAAMLVPAAVIESVGPLAAELFLQVEDVEWSLRMAAAGFGTYLVPAARVWHRVSAYSGGEHSEKIAYYATRNTLEVNRRHAPLSRAGELRRTTETVLAQSLHQRRAAHPLQNLRAVRQGLRDYRSGRLGPRADHGG